MEAELRAREDEALEAFKQELARPRYPTYNLRGDPSTWQLPASFVKPPPSPPAPAPESPTTVMDGCGTEADGGVLL